MWSRRPSIALVVSGTSNRLDPAAPSDAALLAMLSVSPTAILDGTAEQRDPELGLQLRHGGL